MVGLLAKLCIRNHTAYKDPAVRKGYGILCSVMGIVLNLCLTAVKLIAGFLSGSVAVIADGINNLSDAASSLITLLGFWLGGKAPDPEHPFGHGRMEYLAGLAVSVLILWMGVELLISSVKALFVPSEVVLSLPTLILLGISVPIKLYMYFYHRSIGKKIESAAMLATATDSVSDAVSTLVVLVSTVLSAVMGWKIDGICGILVSVLILRAGFSSAKETVSPLLGQPPSKELVEEIHTMVLSHDKIVGMHDMVVHNYGPGRMMISLHAEVPANEDIFLLHDLIDNVERQLCEHFSCEAVIHMDPIAVDDKVVSAMHAAVAGIVHSVHPAISMHDFRMVEGPTHTNLIFDVCVPFSFAMKDNELKTAIEEAITAQFPHCFAVIKIDKAYV